MHTRPFLLLVASVGVFGCPSAPTTITSDDGVVTLELPRGALADDVDIRITPSTTPHDGVLEGFVYAFEPSGLVFEEPVTLRFDVSGLDPAPADGELEIGLVTDLYDETGGRIEGIQHFDTTVGEGTLETTIEHFSAYVVGFGFPRNASYDPATWVMADQSTVATWEYIPQPVACVPRCSPGQWRRNDFYFAFDRAHDPGTGLGSPRPAGLTYQFVGSAHVSADRFEARGNPNAPNDTTIYLRSIEAGYYGKTLHASSAYHWNPVRAFNKGAGTTNPTTPGGSGVCRLGKEEFELVLTGNQITCTSGSCPPTSLVDLEVDWLTADPAGFNASIPVRLVRTQPNTAQNPLLDATFSGFATTDFDFTVTINTGAGRAQIEVPTAALDADGTPGPWVYAVEFGVTAPLAPTDNEIQINGTPPRSLDPAPCNVNAPEITVTIQ